MKTGIHAPMQAYLDGTASPETLAELEEALRRDPGLRKELLVLSGFDAELPAALRELERDAATSRAPPSASGASETPTGSSTPPVPIGRPRRSMKWILWPAAAAAAAAIAVRVLLPDTKPEEKGMAKADSPRVAAVRAPDDAGKPAPPAPPVAAANRLRVRATPAGSGIGELEKAAATPMAMSADEPPRVAPMRMRAMGTRLELDESAAPPVAAPVAMALAEGPVAAAATPPVAMRAMMASAPPAESVEGRLTSVTGSVHVVRKGDSVVRQPAEPGMAVKSGDVITTAAGASALFTYADGSTLRIHKGSWVAVERTGDGPAIRLRAGAVDAVLKKQSDGRAMHVDGRFLTAAASGPEFRLVVDAQSAWMGVRAGPVEVTRTADGKKIALGDGNYSAVCPDWPFMKMFCRACPRWQSVCSQATGSPYP